MQASRCTLLFGCSCRLDVLVVVALSSARVASVRLHSSLELLPLQTPLQIVSTLAGLAWVLTALHGLRLEQLPHTKTLGLPALTRLRT